MCPAAAPTSPGASAAEDLQRLRTSGQRDHRTTGPVRTKDSADAMSRGLHSITPAGESLWVPLVGSNAERGNAVVLDITKWGWVQILLGGVLVLGDLVAAAA